MTTTFELPESYRVSSPPFNIGIQGYQQKQQKIMPALPNESSLIDHGLDHQRHTLGSLMTKAISKTSFLPQVSIQILSQTYK